MQRISFSIAALAALLALSFATACQGTRSSSGSSLFGSLRARPVERAMWVTRFDYQTPLDIEKVMEACELANVDTVLFQVRGNATVSYKSAIEPWSERFGFTDPGFDPLATAIQAAHARGLKLKAWVNVVPAWWGTEPPADTRQVWHAHKDWLWYDAKGKLQPFSDKFYVSLNPCLPEVRRHLGEVMRDLVARYELDGLHLDYIRFPNDKVPAGTDYPRDKRTLTFFKGETGKTPDQDKQAWNAWRAEQVTHLLREIRRQVRQERPNLELSAAVGPEPERALEHHFQDARTWAKEGLVDALYPMNYTRDRALFEKRMAMWREVAKDVPVVMGLRIDSNDIATHEQQLAESLKDFRGYSIFAYSSLFDSPNDEIEVQTKEAQDQRLARRVALLPILRKLSRGDGGASEME